MIIINLYKNIQFFIGLFIVLNNSCQTLDDIQFDDLKF